MSPVLPVSPVIYITPKDFEYHYACAKLSEAVYKGKQNPLIGWGRLRTLAQNDAGLVAAAFINIEKQVIIIAYRGTKTLANWKTDGKLYFSNALQDYDKYELCEFSSTIAEQNPKYKIIETGHSLGAPIALLNAFYLGHAVVVFESLGILEILIERGKKEKDINEKLSHAITYLTVPSFPNTMFKHVGHIYRIHISHAHLVDQEPLDDPSAFSLNFIFSKIINFFGTIAGTIVLAHLKNYYYQQHRLINIIRLFCLFDDVILFPSLTREVIRWPTHGEFLCTLLKYSIRDFGALLENFYDRNIPFIGSQIECNWRGEEMLMRHFDTTLKFGKFILPHPKTGIDNYLTQLFSEYDTFYSDPDNEDRNRLQEYTKFKANISEDIKIKKEKKKNEFIRKEAVNIGAGAGGIAGVCYWVPHVLVGKHLVGAALIFTGAGGLVVGFIGGAVVLGSVTYAAMKYADAQSAPVAEQNIHLQAENSENEQKVKKLEAQTKQTDISSGLTHRHHAGADDYPKPPSSKETMGFASSIS